MRTGQETEAVIGELVRERVGPCRVLAIARMALQDTYGVQFIRDDGDQAVEEMAITVRAVYDRLQASNQFLSLTGIEAIIRDLVHEAVGPCGVLNITDVPYRYAYEVDFVRQDGNERRERMVIPRQDVLARMQATRRQTEREAVREDGDRSRRPLTFGRTEAIITEMARELVGLCYVESLSEIVNRDTYEVMVRRDGNAHAEPIQISRQLVRDRLRARQAALHGGSPGPFLLEDRPLPEEPSAFEGLSIPRHRPWDGQYQTPMSCATASWTGLDAALREHYGPGVEASIRAQALALEALGSPESIAAAKERLRVRTEAETRAYALLVERIGPVAAGNVKNGGAYPIDSKRWPGTTYLVPREGKIIIMKDGVRAGESCLVTTDHSLPWPDVVLQRILAIQADETVVYGTGIYTPQGMP